MLTSDYLAVSQLFGILCEEFQFRIEVFIVKSRIDNNGELFCSWENFGLINVLYVYDKLLH